MKSNKFIKGGLIALTLSLATLSGQASAHNNRWVAPLVTYVLVDSLFNHGHHHKYKKLRKRRHFGSYSRSHSYGYKKRRHNHSSGHYSYKRKKYTRY